MIHFKTNGGADRTHEIVEVLIHEKSDVLTIERRRKNGNKRSKPQ